MQRNVQGCILACVPMCLYVSPCIPMCVQLPLKTTQTVRHPRNLPLPVSLSCSVEFESNLLLGLGVQSTDGRRVCAGTAAAGDEYSPRYMPK